MCLVILAWRVHPDMPAIVAANRDELFARPAEPVHELEDGVFGGKDLTAGGTWLAVNRHGVVAALTNQPLATRKPDAPQGGRDPSKRSRGELPLVLARHASTEKALAAFAGSPRDYNPCALLVADASAAAYIELIGGERAVVRSLAPGIHVLENRPLGEPSPKAEHARSMVADIATWPVGELDQRLLAVLSDSTVPADARALHESTDDWRPLEVEANCVQTEVYGTRSSSIVQLGKRFTISSTNAPPRNASLTTTVVR